MNYLRTLCDAVETVWLLDGPLPGGHRSVLYSPDLAETLETAVRDKALHADFRFPMTDTRLALARLCALGGRQAEATRWFAASRDVLDAQGARPLRAIVDLDEAAVLRHAGDPDAAARVLEAAVDRFSHLGMTGWVHRVRHIGRRW